MKKLWLAVLSICVVAALTACGGGSGSGASQEPVAPTGNTVDLEIKGKNWEFDQKEYQLNAGDTVNLTYTDEEGMHGIVINGLNVDLKSGQSTTFVAEPGEYDVVCSIMCGPGHSKMISKLIVK